MLTVYHAVKFLDSYGIGKYTTVLKETEQDERVYMDLSGLGLGPLAGSYERYVKYHVLYEENSSNIRSIGPSALKYKLHSSEL